MTDAPPLRIAYIGMMTFDEGSIRGGLLVTDERTRPYEFRVSEPVKPSVFQRILYGKTLDESVHVDLIAARLLESAKENISLILTTDETILSLRPRVSYPIACLSRMQGSSSSGLANVGSIMVHKNFSREQEWAEGIIRQLSVHADIFEPFERLSAALIEVHKMRPENR